VSAALLSREVSRLEASLGVALLSRSTRRMTLTEAGRAYYNEALAVLQAVGSFEERSRNEPELSAVI
jgi:DNA-binding transcriptional LysR family regulator